MLDLKTNLDAFPAMARKAVYLLIGGWIGHHLLFVAIFFQRTGQVPTNLLLRHFILGGVIIFFILKKKPWARWLAIMGNVMIIVYYIQWAVLYHLNLAEQGMMVAIGLLFALSTVLLFKQETSEFFRREKERMQAEFKDQRK